MKPIDPPVRAHTVEQVLSAVARVLPLSGGSTHGATISNNTLISEDNGVSTYRVDVCIDRSWDFAGDEGASGHARVRVRPCTDGFEAFELEGC